MMLRKTGLTFWRMIVAAIAFFLPIIGIYYTAQIEAIPLVVKLLICAVCIFIQIKLIIKILLPKIGDVVSTALFDGYAINSEDELITLAMQLNSEGKRDDDMRLF